MFSLLNEKNKSSKSCNECNDKGFTLVELMVSVGLFAIVVTIAMGSIASIVDTNRKSQTLTLVMNNMGFALESMTRTIKTSTEITAVGSYLQFKDQNAEYVTYRYNDEDLSIEKCVKLSQSSCSDSEFISIVSTQVHIDNFELTLLDSGSLDQPRILMVVGGYAEITSDIRSDFDIQTTVSPRELDI